MIDSDLILSTVLSILITVIVFGFIAMISSRQEQKIRPSTARFCKMESINENEKCAYERKKK
jgi:hypothetical protein